MSDSLVRIDDFIASYSAMDRNVFLARFDGPFLVIRLAIPVSSPGESVEPASGKSTIFEEKKKRPTSRITAYVVAIQDLEGVSAEGQILIGRGVGNHIPIPNASVSRRHAVLHVDTLLSKGSVSDAGSSYGTTLNGVPLEAGKTEKIRSGSVIVLGQSVHVTFLSANNFFDYLHTVLDSREC